MEAVVSIKKMDVVCIIGTEPHERATEQLIEIDVEIALNETKACLSDDLADAIDYVAVAELCSKIAKEGQFKLIEALAYSMAKKILEVFSVHWVKIRASKTRPLPHVERCAVELILNAEQAR